MANGELCKICRHQETDHQYSDNTCDLFVSEVRHLGDCPIIDCDGDCEACIAQAEEEAVRSANRLNHTWFLDGPNLVMMDIGS
jgi:hypothetical protein